MDTADVLTPRERQILILVAQGYRNEEIAVRLALSLGTIKRDTGKVCDKLAVHNRAEAIRWAMRQGLVD